MALKVTVITPVLNGERTIADCIHSVKSQDYPYIEHVVVDGVSTDGTMQIVRENGVKFASEKDCGIYDAFNKGITLGGGDIIHILNADDYYADNSVVSRVVRLFETGHCDVVHGRAVQINFAKEAVWTIGADVNYAQLLKKMKVAHPAVFVKRQVYEKHGGFSIGFRVAGDHEFLLRIWDKVKRQYTPDVLVKMRIGGASTSQIVVSYRESLAAAILHGRGVVRAVAGYYWEVAKHYGLIIPLRMLGFKRT